MERILLIGEELPSVQTLKLQLSTHYRVQHANFFDIEKMKIFRPDYVVVYAEAIARPNIIKAKERLVSEDFYDIPMVCVSIPKEEELLRSVFNDKNFKVVERNPFDPKVLVETLKRISAQEESVIKAVKYVNEKKVSDEPTKKRILVVDDDPVVLSTIKSLMDDEFDIVLASSGKDALMYLSKRECDIVLLDYMMPEFDGRETLEAIRNDPKTKHLPVFFLSGISDREKIKLTLELKPQGYILKPASKLDIYEKLEKYM